MMTYVDDMDLEILERLLENARKSFTSIAKELGVSEATIRKHVKALENNRVIIRYTVQVDPGKLGFERVAVIGIDTVTERYLEIVEMLMGQEEVHTLSTTSGDHMIMIEFWARDNREIMAFNRRLTEMDGVTKVCPAIILESMKN